MRMPWNWNSRRRRPRSERARSLGENGAVQQACQPIICKLLEDRRLMSSFGISVAGESPSQAGIQVTWSGQVNFTGTETPSSITVDWKDGNQQNISIPSGFTSWPISHAYTASGKYPISVTAHSTVNSTAIQGLTLIHESGTGYAGYGPNQAGYFATYPPGGTATLNNSGKAIAVDPTDGSTYVASRFGVSSTQAEFCVTKFDLHGNLLSGWGTKDGNGVTHGTTIFAFDSGVDVPTSMFLSTGNKGNNTLVVAGNCTFGWCVGELDVSSAGNGILVDGFGSHGLESRIESTGTCTSVLEENADEGTNQNKVILAGTVSGKMTIVRLTSTGAPDSSPGQWGTNAVQTITIPNQLSSAATTLMQAVFTNKDGNYDILVGGNYLYRYTGFGWLQTSGCGQDVLIAALKDQGGTLDTGSFGYNYNGTSGAGYTHANFGCIAGGSSINCCAGTSYASQDSDATMECWTADGVNWDLFAGCPTDYTTFPTTNMYQFGMLRFTQYGVLDSTWGPNHNGAVAVASGAAGPGSNAAPYAETILGSSDSDASADIVMAGNGYPGGGTGSDFVIAGFSAATGQPSPIGVGGSTSTDINLAGSGGFASGSDAAYGIGYYYDSSGAGRSRLIVGGLSASNGPGVYIGLAAYLPNNYIQVGSNNVPDIVVAGPFSSTLVSAGASQAVAGLDSGAGNDGSDPLIVQPDGLRGPRWHPRLAPRAHHPPG